MDDDSIEGREYIGLDLAQQELERVARAPSGLAYVKLYDGANQSGAIGRFDLNVGVAPERAAVRHAPVEIDRDDDDDDDDDDGDSKVLHLAQASDDDTPPGDYYPNIQAALLATMRWLRARTSAYVVGSTGCTFVVRGMGVKGGRSVVQTRFRVNNTAHMMERVPGDDAADKAGQSRQVSAAIQQMREAVAIRDEGVEGPFIAGTSSAFGEAWRELLHATGGLGRLIATHHAQQIMGTDAMVTMMSNHMAASDKRLQQAYRQIDESHYNRMALDHAANSHTVTEAAKAEVAKAVVDQLGSLARVVATKGDPRLMAIADGIMLDEELLDVLSSPAVLEMMKDADVRATFKQLLKAGAAEHTRKKTDPDPDPDPNPADAGTKAQE